MVRPLLHRLIITMPHPNFKVPFGQLMFFFATLTLRAMNIEKKVVIAAIL